LQEQFLEWFNDASADPPFQPRYNIAPGQDAPVILTQGSSRQLKLLRWGLVPFWARDARTGYKMINAKAETLAEKAAYRKAFERRRCLALADGFYEWKKAGTLRAPYRFIVNDGEPFAFAGLWERWRKPDDTELQTFTIITTEPNDLVRSVHVRMPAILPRSAYEPWLDSEFSDTAQLQMLLRPYPAKDMKGYPVSLLVNSPRNDTPECIAPAPPELNLDMAIKPRLGAGPDELRSE
jgi:putative SOS response-associated peptidase YedK